MSTLREQLEKTYESMEGGESNDVDSEPVDGASGQPSGQDGQDPEADAAGRGIDASTKVGVDPGGSEGGDSGGDSPGAGRSRDGKGRFAKGQAKEEQKSQTKVEVKQSITPKPSDSARLPEKTAVAPIASPAAESIKPPQSWKPAAREKFAALPPEVQQEVLRVDKEVRQVMQESAEPKRFHQQFTQAIQPFMPMIAASGADPIRAAASLFQTAAALRHGTPRERAGMVAKIIGEYGVPLEDLVSALEQGPQQPQQRQQQYMDPDAFAQQVQQKVIQGIQQQQRQALLQKNTQEIEQFQQEAEFLDDVKDDMADIMDSYARRHKDITLKQAYEKACLMHPEISEIFKQREAAKQANATQASTLRAKAAASSVKTQPASAPAVKQGGSIRSALEDAWSKYSG